MILLNKKAARGFDSYACFIGFDPGTVNGCISVLSLTGAPLVDVHLISDKKSYLVCKLEELRANRKYIENGVVLAETQGMRPGQGLSSNAKLLNCYTFIIGYFVGLGLPVFTCTAEEWQNGFSLGGKHGPTGCSPSTEYNHKKKAHLSKAQKIFSEPLEEWQADARLIAKYLYDVESGLFEV